MDKFRKGIDVLCVFTEGSSPNPKRFKIKYRNGNTKTVTVDQIRFIEEKFKNGISNHHFIYHCTSEIEEILINYELKYYVLDMRWELEVVA